VWPLLVYSLPRRSVLTLSLALVAAAPVLRAAALYLGVSPVTVHCLTIFRADSLALGGVLAVVLREPQMLARVRERSRWTAIAGAAVVAGLTARHRFFSKLDWDVQIIGFSALAVIFGSLLLSAVTAPESSRLRRVLSSPKLTFFGKYSYGAYLLHELLRPAFVRFFPVEALKSVVGSEVLAFLTYVVLATAVTFLLAVVTFQLYERPFLDLKRFFEYRPDPALDDARSGVSSEAQAALPGSD
jgi:peptidoglycan/LPS O-acetylase OafA/YrhL